MGSQACRIVGEIEISKILSILQEYSRDAHERCRCKLMLMLMMDRSVRKHRRGIVRGRSIEVVMHWNTGPGK